MSSFRALWLVRPDLYRDPGGDTTQIEETRARLGEQGVSVTVCSDRTPRMAGYDVVHLFHLDRLWENAPRCHAIAKQGIPAVLSPIYFPTDDLDRGGRTGLQGALAKVAGTRAYPSLRMMQRATLASAVHRDLRSLRTMKISFERGLRAVLASVRVVLPNSQTERDVLRERFGVRIPNVIVPNGVDPVLFHPSAAGERAGVLCVGRLVPRKNQLALIRALNGTGTPLRLVGSQGHLGHGYVRRCRREAGPETEFVGLRSKESVQRLYRSARVHVSVSWFETPGLASLEAAACGCSLVVTPGGCTREYFGDQARYCEPDDLGSIRTAVERALAAPPPTELAARVRREYSWSIAAERTRKAYELALGAPPRSSATRRHGR